MSICVATRSNPASCPSPTRCEPCASPLLASWVGSCTSPKTPACPSTRPSWQLAPSTALLTQATEPLTHSVSRKVTRSSAAAKQRMNSTSGFHSFTPVLPPTGYRHWHADLRPDDTPLEAGLAFTCKMKSSIPFQGRDRLEEQKKEGLKRRIVCFTIDE